MEDKKTMKIGLGTAISIAIIIILLIVGAFLIYNNNSKISELEQQINNQKAEVEKNIEISKNTIEGNSTKSSKNTEKATNEVSNYVVPSIYTGNGKNIDKEATYQLYKEFNADECYIYMYVKDGKPYISTAMSFEKYGFDANNIKIVNQREYEITGFSKSVVDIYIGGIGQNVLSTYFLFLMEDGTVEYSTIDNMLNNISTQGEISGLNNIVKFQDVSVTDPIGFGYVSIIAIDKDNNCYDISKSL